MKGNRDGWLRVLHNERNSFSMTDMCIWSTLQGLFQKVLDIDSMYEKQVDNDSI